MLSHPRFLRPVIYLALALALALAFALAVSCQTREKREQPAAPTGGGIHGSVFALFDVKGEVPGVRLPEVWAFFGERSMSSSRCSEFAYPIFPSPSLPLASGSRAPEFASVSGSGS